MGAFSFPIRRSDCLRKKGVDKFSLRVPSVCMACWTAIKFIDAVVWFFS